jgi:RNA polymerase sigma-70 factor (ECF subfamily)
MQDALRAETIEAQQDAVTSANDVPAGARDIPMPMDPSQKRRIAHRIAAEIPGIRRYARRLERNPDEAEDLVQDALERALRKSHGWRGGSLAGWLRRIVFTVFANRRSRTVRTEADIPVDGALETASPPDQEDRLACRDIARAVDALPAEQRIAVSLAIRPESSYEENAQAAGMPVGTFRSRLSRAREKLRDRLTAPQTQAAQWRVG